MHDVFCSGKNWSTSTCSNVRAVCAQAHLAARIWLLIEEDGTALTDTASAHDLHRFHHHASSDDGIRSRYGRDNVAGHRCALNHTCKRMLYTYILHQLATFAEFGKCAHEYLPHT
jgi:hypothetical protein